MRLEQGRQPHRPEITVRGLLLGAAITVVFMAANVYMGLKSGMTFSSSIPAAVISMGLLRLVGTAGVLENNIVQTQASAAGTLCNVILVLPGLVLIGQWQGFPFWQTSLVCLVGGLLGVMYSVPLRRAMVVGSDLPFPEGIAAAEVLRVEGGRQGGAGGLADLIAGGLAAGLFSLFGTGFRLLGDGVSLVFSVGHAVFRFGTGFSLAMIGVGYLVGFGACLALLLGVLLAWGVAVPLLTAAGAPPAGSPGDYATALWSGQVRLIGAGIIAVGGLWTVVTLLRPMLASLRGALAAARAPHGEDARLPRQERDLPIVGVALAAGALALVLAILLGWFTLPALGGRLGAAATAALVAALALFTVVFGFLMATACGYMAGLLGSSSSPISGIGILTTILISLLLTPLLGLSSLGGDPAARRAVVALALFVASVIVTISSIANDNLQDLKTGQIVDATPWRQQAALLVGVAVGALVVPPVLELLYQAYGFSGALPRDGMDAASVMAAPQASLMTTIARGIAEHRLPWRMVVIGVVLGAALVGGEAWLRRRGVGFPALTVGIGMYLPPAVVVTIAIGGVLGRLSERAIGRRDPGGHDAAERLRRRGVLLASGFLVGESFVGILLAASDGVAGHSSALRLAGPGFAGTATWLGCAAFLVALALFYRAVTRGA